MNRLADTPVGHDALYTLLRGLRVFSVKSAAQVLGYSPSYTQRLIDRMVARGLIRRHLQRNPTLPAVYFHDR